MEMVEFRTFFEKMSRVYGMGIPLPREMWGIILGEVRLSDLSDSLISKGKKHFRVMSPEGHVNDGCYLTINSIVRPRKEGEDYIIHGLLEYDQNGWEGPHHSADTKTIPIVVKAFFCGGINMAALCVK